jgi:sulfite exporter TauE/SafE
MILCKWRGGAMKCDNCGAELSARAQFCEMCGNRVRTGTEIAHKVSPLQSGATTSYESDTPLSTHQSTLTGGRKAAYFCLGLLLGAPGVLITWLINRRNPIVEDVVKISVIGFLVWLTLGCLSILLLVVFPLTTRGFF